MPRKQRTGLSRLTRYLEGRWLLVLGLYDLLFGLLAFALFDYLIED